MFRIKKKGQRLTKQDPAVPMQVTRALLFSLRHTHAWQQLLIKAYRAMPAEWQSCYRTYAELQIGPTFDELIQLINSARQQGFLTEDEAASLRAGKPIELHFQSEESQPVLNAQSQHSGPACCAAGDTADA